MKLPKDEKKFWQRNYRVENINDIPTHWDIFRSVDSECDDEFLYYLSLRVISIEEIRLKQTLVTNDGIKYLCNFKDLETLYLRKHDTITKASIPYFNEMKDLKSLDITRTAISLSDLCEKLNNQSLRQVFVSADEEADNITEIGFILKERMPNCDFYLNTSFTTTVFDSPIKPIF